MCFYLREIATRDYSQCIAQLIVPFTGHYSEIDTSERSHFHLTAKLTVFLGNIFKFMLLMHEEMEKLGDIDFCSLEYRKLSCSLKNPPFFKNLIAQGDQLTK